MEFIMQHLLLLILFLPAAFAVIIMLLPRGQDNLTRWIAFVLSTMPFILSVVMWLNFKPNIPGFQFQELYAWYPPINSTLHLGVDGISLSMILLTTLLTPLAILASFTITTG